MSSSKKPVKFCVAGLMVSFQFQQCQYIVNKLHRYYPEIYLEPQIRPMLNVDWEGYLLKMRRKYGRKELWKLSVPVAVFKNGEFFGDNEVLVNYATELYSINLKEDFAQMGEKQLVDYFGRMESSGRHFTYLLLTINNDVIGTLVIMLYSDLVPEACRIFMNRCRRNIFGYAKVSLVRIVPNSWLQFKALQPSELYSIPCENYKVPHDRRGVVSLYKLSRNRLSGIEFMITLDSTPWMDKHFVAFGQVIQGEETLKILERAPVEHEVPTQKIEIKSSDRLVVSERQRPVETYIISKTTSETFIEPKEDDRDSISTVDSGKLKEGLYCLPTDLRSYLPFLHLPDYLLAYLKNNMLEGEETAREPVQEENSEEVASYQSFHDNFSMQNVDRSRGFIIRSREDFGHE